MKKQLGMFVMTACMAVFLAFSLPGMAKAESLGVADQPAKVAEVAAPGTLNASSVIMKIGTLSPTYVSLEFNDSTYEKEIQLINRFYKVVKTTTCYTYGSFSLAKNNIYYLRFRLRAYDYNTGSYVYGDWSGRRGICTVGYSLKLTGGKVRYKAPKVKGVKNFKIYLSKSSGSKYKKIKTLKPGKSFKFNKFRGKKLKKNKKYYYYSIAKAKNGLNFLCPAGYWWIY